MRKYVNCSEVDGRPSQNIGFSHGGLAKLILFSSSIGTYFLLHHDLILRAEVCLCRLTDGENFS